MRTSALWWAVLAGGLVLAARPGRGNEPATPAAAVILPGNPDLVDDMRAAVRLHREAVAAIRQKMQTRVSEPFKDTPLREVVERLSRAGDLPIVLETAALAEEGIPIDEPITERLRDATIEQALNRMLPPLGLTWIIADEALHVTTQSRASEKFEMRLYDVGRLQQLARERFQSAADFPVMPDPLPEALESLVPPVRLHRDWLVRLLPEYTAGEWQDVDGFGGQITRLGRMLLVRQTQKGHDEIAALLTTLERLAAGDVEPLRIVRPGTETDQADRKIARALRQTGDWSYTGRPLRDTLEDIGERVGITTVVDFGALSEEGIADDEPLSVDLRGVTLDAALRTMLDPLGLTFLPNEGTLLVTTNTKAAEQLMTMAYDVRDLSRAGYGGAGLIRLIVEGTAGEWKPIDGVGGMVSEPFPGALLIRQRWAVLAEVVELLEGLRERLATLEAPDGDELAASGEPVTRFYPQADHERAVALQTVLPQLVAPEQWDRPDGMPRVLVVGSTLVVRQTPAVQARIRQFLEELEQSENDLTLPFGTGAPSRSAGGLGF